MLKNLPSVIFHFVTSLFTAPIGAPEQLPLTIGPNVLAGYGWGLVGRVMMDAGQSMSLTGGGEFGWAGAASTYFWVDPARSMTGVIMSQYLGASMPLSDDMRTAAYQLV